MKKNFAKFIILFLFLFISVQIVFAYSSPLMQSGQYFGGKIINTKATEIETLEAGGFICNVIGTSLTIRPIRGPATYAIPFITVPKTKSTPAIGKWIIGRYSGKTMITCTKPGPTPVTTTVSLDTITMFGTS